MIRSRFVIAGVRELPVESLATDPGKRSCRTANRLSSSEACAHSESQERKPSRDSESVRAVRMGRDEIHLAFPEVDPASGARIASFRGGLFEDRDRPGQNPIHDSLSGTAKPMRRANSPPWVIGRMAGRPVARLNSSGDATTTGRCPRCSLPSVGSRSTM